MTYGFRPENWPAFEEELQRRGIAVDDIEKVEMRPGIPHDLGRSDAGAGHASAASVQVVVTLRSGRVESWRQAPAATTSPVFPGRDRPDAGGGRCGRRRLGKSRDSAEGRSVWGAAAHRIVLVVQDEEVLVGAGVGERVEAVPTAPACGAGG